MRGVKIDTVRFFNKVKVLMLRGERGERPSISETPIDNGYHVSFGYEDGEVLSFDLTNATSGNYSQLFNKPSINGVLLSGDKSTQDLLLDYDYFIDKPQINGVELDGDKTGKSLGLVSVDDLVFMNLSKQISISGNAMMNTSIEFPDHFDLSDYKVIGVPQFKSASITYGWSIVFGLIPDKWSFKFGMFNPTSSSVSDYIDITLALLRVN